MIEIISEDDTRQLALVLSVSTEDSSDCEKKPTQTISQSAQDAERNPYFIMDETESMNA